MTQIQETLTQELFEEAKGETFAGQATWFLNAYWKKEPLNLAQDHQERERIWGFVKFCEELHKSENKSVLDEFQAHRFLEKNGEALTVREMREVFAKTGLAMKKNISLLEILIFMLKADWKLVANAPQYSEEVGERLQEADRELRAMKIGIEQLREKEAELKNAEKGQRLAEKEVREGLQEIQKEEEELQKLKADLEEKSRDENLGIVKRNKAAHELHNLNAKDYLPLKTAKIQQESNVRKQERLTRGAVKVREEAAVMRKESEDKVTEVEERVAALMEKASAGQGRVWWMQREIQESKKYMSKKQLLRSESSESSVSVSSE